MDKILVMILSASVSFLVNIKVLAISIITGVDCREYIYL